MTPATLGADVLVPGTVFVPLTFSILAALAPRASRTIGAVGTLGLSIMTSMIRKHGKRAFQRQGSASAAFAAVTVSCLSRLLAGALPGDPAVWTALSGGAWIAAFCLFLVSFAQLERTSRRPPIGVEPSEERR